MARPKPHLDKRRWLLPLLLLVGCASTPTPGERYQRAVTLAAAHGWQPLDLDGRGPNSPGLGGGLFSLVAFVPGKLAQTGNADAGNLPGGHLTVYLEGDGHAWVDRHQPSQDPTPLDPVGLALALAHPAAGAVAYLARPCQYRHSAACSPRHWTDARYSEAILAATSHAIDTLKARASARTLTLVGYSGGAAIAALLAAERPDVRRLVSVAGNLDHRAWTDHHRLSPLAASRNPADEAGRLAGVAQWHFGGGRDRVVPVALLQDFVARFPPGRRPVLHIEPDFDHRCCWVAAWPRLWALTGDE